MFQTTNQLIIELQNGLAHFRTELYTLYTIYSYSKQWRLGKTVKKKCETLTKQQAYGPKANPGVDSQLS